MCSYSAASSTSDRSKRFTLHPHWQTCSFRHQLHFIQPCNNYVQRLFTHISTAVIYAAEWTGVSWRERKRPSYKNNNSKAGPNMGSLDCELVREYNKYNIQHTTVCSIYNAHCDSGMFSQMPSISKYDPPCMFTSHVTHLYQTINKMKWSWAGHSSHLKDDRWTSRVTTWRPYDKKRLQGRPAKRWRDDLDKYWSDTIWQRTAQDRVIWRWHAEAFAQPRDTTAA